MTGPALLHLALLLLAVHGQGDLDDAALTRRIRQGDARAFRAFFDRYHGLLYRYLRKRGVPGDVTEDLVQLAFLTIWERRADLDDGQSLRAFLFKIGYNRALNHFRDTARFVDVDQTDLDGPSAAPGQDHEAALHLMQRTLDEAVAALPERRRLVFELCFLEGLTYREAAEIMDVSIKTVENQMGHALKAIREAMALYR